MESSFERCLIEQCAPTLAGIKLGSLFNYTAKIGENVQELVLCLNRRLRPKGLIVCLVKERSDGGLVYVYRPSMLTKLVAKKDVSDFLLSQGFPASNAAECIEELQLRLRQDEEFPHEIGIFLGYPLQDVRGFIENKGLNYSLLGLWKVYDNGTFAKKLFEQYRKCKNIYADLYEGGRDIVKLAVSA